MSKKAKHPAGRKHNHLWEQQYAILADLLKLQHTRVHNHTLTFLTANTILVSGVAIIASRGGLQTWGYLSYVGMVGLPLSVLWLFMLLRLRCDTKLRLFQLRYVEDCLGLGKGIFTWGNVYFNEQRSLAFTDRLGGRKTLGLPKWYGGVRASWSVVVLPVVFLLTNAALIVSIKWRWEDLTEPVTLQDLTGWSFAFGSCCCLVCMAGLPALLGRVKWAFPRTLKHCGELRACHH